MSTTSTIPIVSEGEVRSRVGEQSFQRGHQYFRDGAIFDTRRQGMTLKARCAGSRRHARAQDGAGVGIARPAGVVMTVTRPRTNQRAGCRLVARARGISGPCRPVSWPAA
jgi:hypothetical protein